MAESDLQNGDHLLISLVQNVDSLRLVSADKAKTVIIMDPDHGTQGQVCAQCGGAMLSYDCGKSELV